MSDVNTTEGEAPKPDLSTESAADPNHPGVVTGDVRAEGVQVVNPDDPTTITAGEYREAGYDVPSDVKDDEVPPIVQADRPAPVGTVTLEDGTQYQTGGHEKLPGAVVDGEVVGVSSGPVGPTGPDEAKA